ncbi:MAG: CHAD domain-containing protein [bacterium]
MFHPMRFELQKTHNEQALFSALKAHYSSKEERKTQKNSVLYDTFDWRLYNKSLSLSHSGNVLSVKKIIDGSPVDSITTSTVPKFVWDLPDSSLKRQLQPILEMRALLKILEIHICATPIRVLNEDEKTVALFIREESSIVNQKNKTVFLFYLHLKAVRGYEAEAKHLVEILEATGLALSQESVYKKALAAAGREAGAYSAKLNLALHPGMRSDEAAKAILRFLLNVMKQNEDGIKRDIDTEFLHDFRVAIRRTRSALSQIKNVFPEKITTRFKNGFSDLGKSTNQLRDLDVYLLHADEYKNMLPIQLRAEIDPLFDKLEEEREKALQNVTAVLDSPEYTVILRDWQAFLNQPPATTVTAPNAAVPVIRLAKKRIHKRYGLIIKNGSEITATSEDRLFHRLRIECKKLRYLLEFFSSLFAIEKVNYLIKQLKKLQDNLGRFQDLCVQEEELQNFIDAISLKNHRARKTIAAIGSLIGTLDREKQTVRAQFAEIIAEFASDGNSKVFQELFKSKRNEDIS